MLRSLSCSVLLENRDSDRNSVALEIQTHSVRERERERIIGSIVDMLQAVPISIHLQRKKVYIKGRGPNIKAEMPPNGRHEDGSTKNVGI